MAYLAPADLEAVLRAELLRSGERFSQYGRLFCMEATPVIPPAWVQNTWHSPRIVPAPSITQGARALRNIQKHWASYSHAYHRRAALIQEKLAPNHNTTLRCCDSLPETPMGSWMLLDEQTMLVAPHCDSPFPNGKIAFAEDTTGPPSRAYLKLWEVFTRLGRYPEPDELCLDLGAAPGGWTWVLASLGCQVLAVDKASLDPQVAALPGVVFRQASAFAIDPRAGKNDVHPQWLFSDVICYPQKLLTYVRRWLEFGSCPNFVCTLKFQGETDFATMEGFRALGGQLVHLSHNKHELTWVYTSP